MCCYKFLSVCHPRFLFSCVHVHVYFDKIHLCICRSLLLNASFISTSLIWIGNLCYDDNIYIYKHMYRHIAVYLIECTCTCTCNPVSSVFDKLIWAYQITVSYLELHSSHFGPDGAVTCSYSGIITNSIDSLLIGSLCIPNGAHINRCLANLLRNLLKTLPMGMYLSFEYNY